MADQEFSNANLLKPEDNYVRQCGMIYISGLGTLVYQCAHCPAKYTDMAKYQDHLRDKHYKNNISSSYGLEQYKLNAKQPKLQQRDDWNDNSQILKTANKQEDRRHIDIKKQSTAAEVLEEELVNQDDEEQLQIIDATDKQMEIKGMGDATSETTFSQQIDEDLLSNGSLEETLLNICAEQSEEKLQKAPTNMSLEAAGSVPHIYSFAQCLEKNFATSQAGTQKVQMATVTTGQINYKEQTFDKTIENMQSFNSYRTTLQEVQQKEIPEIHTSNDIESATNDSIGYETQVFDEEELEEQVELEKNHNIKDGSIIEHEQLEIAENPALTDKEAPNDFPIWHQCHKCNKIFNTKSILNTHMYSHAEIGQFGCHFCGKKFKVKGNCTAHIRRHEGEGKHQCEVCSKRFINNTELRSHQRKHTGETPFICQVCGKGFKRSGSLKAHMLRHENIRNYSCEVCNKAFLTSEDLKGHQLVHSVLRPFACNICSSTFTRKKALTCHLKLHANAREYKCSYCGVSYNQRPTYTTHLKNVHGVVTKVGVQVPEITKQTEWFS